MYIGFEDVVSDGYSGAVKCRAVRRRPREVLSDRERLGDEEARTSRRRKVS
jgi:hypothetical protein